ncbi:hypothetical protein SE17_01170 [Kouleothrix aurantiaca]|uniref:Capsid protein n=1 Tax=Kouleothrix aurantiaca TaxID=186479 RepID=A0A0P9FDM9_9CHLR|nr:hypothetical protein SE17_01170 [Kouleothrix aurantiaca]
MADALPTDRGTLYPKHTRYIDESKTNPGDLLAQMGPQMYEAAYKRGISLSAMLELEAPSTPEELKDGLDTFSRVLKYAGIRSHAIPELGIYASPLEDFLDSQTRALFPEWGARVWRKAQMGHFTTRAYQADDYAPGSIMNAWADQNGIRLERKLAPAIPLNAIVAQTTPVTGGAVRTFYMTDNAANERMVRVGELGEFPRATLTGGERMIRLRKYGRAFEMSYEDLRRVPIDRIAFHLARLAIQTEIDKVAAAIDVLINGDGNANTAATSINLTTLDSGATVGNLTLKAYIAYKMKLANPYMLTTILAQELIALQMLLLNVGSANVPLVNVANQMGIGQFRALNSGLSDGTELGWTTDAPSNQIVGFDARAALERYIEVGASLQETAKFITNQSQVLVLSEVEAFGILDQNATKILNLAA